MRSTITRLLFHWLIKNSGSLPSEMIVNPVWACSVAEFLAELDVTISTRGDAAVGDDVRLVA